MARFLAGGTRELAVPGRALPQLLRAEQPARYHWSVPMRQPRSVRLAGTIALVGGALITVAPSGRADIFKTVDEHGVVSFSNTPKKGAKLYAREAKPKTAAVMPSDQSPERFTRYDLHIRQAATLYQIPEELVRAVIKVESNYDPRAVSRANARGLMQLIPPTAARMLVTDMFDPRQNIFGGVRYLRVLANLFNGDLQLTIAAYNAGEGAVMRYGGIPPYEETRNYVDRVLAYYRHYRAQNPGHGPVR
jgi:soluble lytic murein transglycosylase-like protein